MRLILSDVGNTLHVDMSGLDLSYANAIRRTLESDIPILCFKEPDITIVKNSSGTANDIVKHRLGCIPICLYLDNSVIKQFDDLLLQIKQSASSEKEELVTSEHFIVINTRTGEQLDTAKLFPPFLFRGQSHFIQFLKLPPQTSIELSCPVRIGTASENGKYNAVCECTLTAAIDQPARQAARNAFVAQKEILSKHELNNWDALNGPRFTIPDSHLLVLETVGGYRNTDLLKIALSILRSKFEQLVHKLTVLPQPEEKMPNCIYIQMPDTTYTEGNILVHEIYSHYFGTRVTYVAFSRMHPHDPYCLLKIAFASVDEMEGALRLVNIVVNDNVIPRIDAMTQLIH